MFGYIKVLTPELKVREQEYYRGIYCGLCRSMGKCTGQCSRATLSYDFAFLALIRILIAKENCKFEQKRCFAHPLRKRNTMKLNAQLDYCAYAAALLSYHKLRDDINDERGFRRLGAYIAAPTFRGMRRKALKRGNLYDLDAKISKQLCLLGIEERSGNASVDRPAEIFGNILSEIMCSGFDGKERRITASIGFHIGKLIYITDALDDIEDDIKCKRYNPFTALYNGVPDKKALGGISDALKNELCEAEKAFDLIDCDNNPDAGAILNNIIYLGIPNTIDKILTRHDMAQGKDDVII